MAGSSGVIGIGDWRRAGDFLLRVLFSESNDSRRWRWVAYFVMTAAP